MKRHVFGSWLFIIAASFLCAACGGKSNNSSSISYIRLVNATQVAGLTLTATNTSDSTNTTAASNIAVGAASSYASLTSSTYSVIVSASDGSLATSSTTSLALSADVKYTVVAYARGGQLKLLAITDSKTTPSTGFASVTTLNAGSDAGPLDVYVVTTGTSIADITPTFSDVAASSTSLTQLVSAGTYDIVVTGYNKPTDVRLTIPAVALTSTEIVNLVLTSTSGGTLVDSALVQQGGSVQLQPAVTARVRVAAAFPANGSSNSVVMTTIGGTSLGAVTSPAVGTYGLVPANSTSYTISVDGTAIATLPSETFASGSDYTIMVYGASSASPTVAVFSDNNLLPSTGAKIRVINGAVSTAVLSLSDNYVPLFSEIGYGNASQYVGVTAGTSALVLSSPSSSFNTYSTSISLLSSSVYTLFALGPTNTSVILVKDR